MTDISMDGIRGPFTPPDTVTGIRAWLEALEGDFLLADGFDDAIIGVTEHSPGRPAIVVYSVAKCIQILVARDSMSWGDAMDFFYTNAIGAWVGPQTPIFLTVPEAL